MSWAPWLGRGAPEFGKGAPRTGPSAQAIEKRVDDALRRWRTSGVPLDESMGAQGRRERVATTIAAAMRQARLERQGARRNRWVLGVAAALVLGLGAVGLGAAGYTAVGSGGSGSDRVLAGERAALTRHSGRVWVGAEAASVLTQRAPVGPGGRALQVGDRVVTHQDGEAGLEVGDDTEVRLSERSELVLARNDAGQKRLALEAGRIEVAVEPARDARQRRTVIVDTPDAAVRVHGTKFAVSVQRDGAQTRTEVRVMHGEVAVLQEGVEQVRLRAGQTWSSVPGPSAERAPTGPPPVEANESDAVPVAVPVEDSPKPVARSPRVAGQPVPATPPREVRQEARQASLKSSTLPQENALFSKALTFRNQGDDAAAVRVFDQLLSKYPRSTLVQEAKVERFRALKRLGRDRDAAREARRYLVDHGNGFATDEARDVALTQ